VQNDRHLLLDRRHVGRMTELFEGHFDIINQAGHGAYEIHDARTICQPNAGTGSRHVEGAHVRFSTCAAARDDAHGSLAPAQSYSQPSPIFPPARSILLTLIFSSRPLARHAWISLILAASSGNESSRSGTVPTTMLPFFFFGLSAISSSFLTAGCHVTVIGSP